MSFDLNYYYDLVEQLQAKLKQVTKERDLAITECNLINCDFVNLKNLLSGDGYASGFQSISQYRSSILKIIKAWETE